MIEEVYKIDFLSDKRGKVPFIEWYNNLDRVNKKRIYKKLDRVKIGNLGDYKNIKKDLFEFRLKFGSGYRMGLSRIKIFVEFFAILIFFKRTYIFRTLTFKKKLESQKLLRNF